MQRRNFLRHLLATPIAATTLMYGNQLRLAQAATRGKTLVVIFQRGGCDGLNTIVPYGDPNYYALRGTTIAVPSPATDPRAAIDLNGFFGLHPSLAPLYDIYRKEHLAILPAVHFEGATRSHFVNQDSIESGFTNRLSDGWLNRHLVAEPKEGSIRAISFGSGVAHALRGSAQVSVIKDLSQIGLGAPGSHENDLRAYLREVYNQSINPVDANRFLVYKNGNVLLDNLDILGGINPSTYLPANGAVYPETGYGKQLRQAAQLIKEDIGLEVVTISIGGWDHHNNQGGAEVNGKQSLLHEDFSQGIKALYTDLGNLMKEVLILTMTEFGRTAAVNGSLGTDHGYASAWMVIGHNVKGDIYGTWPGLRTDQLHDGRFLEKNFDYRDVLGEILVKHLGDSNLNEVLPDYTNYHPIGFLS